MRQAAAQHRSGVRPQAGCAPPYRSTPRARTRPASVIDRLLKNQNPFENSNNLRSSSPHLVVPGNRRNFAVRNSSTPEAIAVPIADVRFGHSMTRRRDGRRPPLSEDPAQTRHAFAGGFDNRITGSSALFSRGYLVGQFSRTADHCTKQAQHDQEEECRRCKGRGMPRLGAGDGGAGTGQS